MLFVSFVAKKWNSKVDRGDFFVLPRGMSIEQWSCLASVDVCVNDQRRGAAEKRKFG